MPANETTKTNIEYTHRKRTEYRKKEKEKEKTLTKNLCVVCAPELDGVLFYLFDLMLLFFACLLYQKYIFRYSFEFKIYSKI